MANKILKSIIIVAITVLMSSFLVVTGFLYQDFTEIQKSQLKEELHFAAIATERLGIDYLEDLKTDEYRITWIDQEGKVLYDSQANIEIMDNHKDRIEIKEALESGEGESSRYSDTLMEKTIYEAIRLKDGTILRLSIANETATSFAINNIKPIIFIGIIAVLFSFWLVDRVAKSIVEPINQLNLDDPLKNETYEELNPLLQRLSSQHQEIESQMHILKHKQEEFDQIINNMQEALILLSKDERVISLNKAAHRLFENTSIQGKRLGANWFDGKLKNAITFAKEEGHAEFSIDYKDKNYLFTVSRIEVDDEIQGILIIVIDMTEQANALKMRQEFTANVSHELKTPLQSIIGSAELISQGIVKDEDLPRFVGHIQKEASRLVHLIDDIIRLAELDEGHYLKKEEISFNHLLLESLEVLDFAIKEKNIQVQIEAEEVFILASKNLLFELVYNLIDNAIRYNKTNGFIKLHLSEKADEIIFKVEDSGIGIAEEDKNKVFERFYRVDKSHSKQSGGTGLGLSIVKNAAKYHHASIQIESQLNKGTIISVIFSKKEADEAINGKIKVV